MNHDHLEQIRSRIRELLLQQKLPYAPRHIFAGIADGRQICTVCSKAIEQDKAEFEYDGERQGQRQILYVHSDCYNVWHAETIRLKLERHK